MKPLLSRRHYKERNMKEIESFELCVYHRMLKIPWTDKITNREVLNQVEQETEVMLQYNRERWNI